jgi:hypothetical protein
MLPSEQELVVEVIQRNTFLQERDPDALDTVEMVVELQKEFGTEAVKWAFRFLVARGVAEGSRRPSGKMDPM